MDSFTEFVQRCWGAMTLEQASAAMKLRTSTIQTWLAFISTFVMARLSAGQPVPTKDEIVNEWHKDHPAAHVVSTPFGDTVQPVGGGTPADFITELKALMSRYSL